jgi:hypothetical protein
VRLSSRTTCAERHAESSNPALERMAALDRAFFG